MTVVSPNLSSPHTRVDRHLLFVQPIPTKLGPQSEPAGAFLFYLTKVEKEALSHEKAQK